MDDAMLFAQQVSETDNATLQTIILGLIMVVGTGVIMWLLLKYGNRGA